MRNKSGVSEIFTPNPLTKKPKIAGIFQMMQEAEIQSNDTYQSKKKKNKEQSEKCEKLTPQSNECLKFFAPFQMIQKFKVR